MSWFVVVLLVLGAIVACLLFLASRKPDSLVIERRALISAPPEDVFAQIADFEAWQAWSPWAKKDPNAQTSFGSVRAGPGASFRWQGNSKVGTGAMTIVEHEPFTKVGLRLDFEKPFRATNMAEFALQPKGQGTEVVWSMRGAAPLMSKVMDVLMNMDKMVGADVEAGLANLKAQVERR